MPPDDDDPPAPPGRPPPRPLRPAVRAFLSRKDVVRWVHDHVRHALPDRDHENVAQGALVEGVEKVVWPDSDEEGVLWATLRTATDRAVADALARITRRGKHEGPMPAAPTKQDDAGEHVRDDEADGDPAHDPRAEDARVEGMLLRRFLADAVKGDARDEQTYGWMLAWSDEGKTFEQISRESGVKLPTVHSRVHDFKEKYLPRYRRWRNRTVLALLLVVTAIAAIVALLLRRAAAPQEIGPAPFPWPPPPPSASAVPAPPEPPPSNDNALPTQPDGRK